MTNKPLPLNKRRLKRNQSKISQLLLRVNNNSKENPDLLESKEPQDKREKNSLIKDTLEEVDTEVTVAEEVAVASEEEMMKKVVK